MRAAKVDANQAEIVRALRYWGCTVEVTSMVGGGFPDLVVGLRGVNHLIEIKDGNKPPSARLLTTEQERWHRQWLGKVIVVENVMAALRAVGVIRGDER